MKQQVSQLAIFGGPPLFESPLHVGQPNLPDVDELTDRIRGVLNSGYLTNNGPQVDQFEAAIARRCGVAHCIAVCNGTMALQIMARASGLSGEVIVPSLTFVATPHALEWIGLTPVFADIDPATHTLDPSSVEASITPKTSAILAVHLWGNPCRVQQLQSIASRHNLKLLFDASHAFGGRHKGQPVGGFGDAEVFSFHATKFVHALEGGAIVTNDDEIAERCRRYRNFGITGLTSIESAGINGKLSEVAAAAGIVSLENIDPVLKQNHINRSTWIDYCAGISGLQFLPSTADTNGNAQYVVGTIDRNNMHLTRDQLLQVLRAEGILARSYFVPGCHNAEPYRQSRVHRPVPLPVTERILDQIIQFPTGLAVSEQQIRQSSYLLQFVQTECS